MKSALLVLLVAQLAACASTPVPQAKLETAHRQLATANALGAPCEPRAALHALLSKEQTDKAKQLIAHEEHEQAARLLDRACSDAELAIAYAQGAEGKEGCEQWQERLDSVQD